MNHHSFRVTRADVRVGVCAPAVTPSPYVCNTVSARTLNDAGLVDAALLSPESVYMTGI